MVGSDAWNEKTSAHASTSKLELMHEEEKQGTMHHFSPECGPALIRATSTNREIDAGTLKNNVPASIGSPGLPPPSK